MASEISDTAKPMLRIDRQTVLAAINPYVWFLGHGLGCAAGFGSLYAVLVIWDGKAPLLAIPLMMIALIHATFLAMFWLNRKVVLYRTAQMISMIASSVLTFAVAEIVRSNGMATMPLYGLAMMHLIMAFCHPSNFKIKTKTD